MLSRAKLNKLQDKLEQLNNTGNTCDTLVVEAKEGLFYFDFPNNIRRQKIDEAIPGLEVHDLTDTSIENIVVAEGAPFPIFVRIEVVE